MDRNTTEKKKRNGRKPTRRLIARLIYDMSKITPPGGVRVTRKENPEERSRTQEMR